MVRIVLGGVYVNDRYEEIAVVYKLGERIAYEHLRSGRRLKTPDLTSVKVLRELLVKGNFRYDHKQSW